MNSISYTLTLLDPAFIPTIEGDPNSAISYPYIPGSSLRGALVSAYMRRQNLAELSDNDKLARALFFDGTVRYLNAYPASDEGQRTLPTPLSWYVEKGRDEPIYDFAVQVRPEAQWESIRGEDKPFVWLSNGRAVFYHPLLQINLHTTRDPEKGRAVRGVGTVFQYQALALGQQFKGVILVEDETSESEVRSLLNQEVWTLGGSRNAGYGRVQLVVEPASESAWREARDELEDIPAGRPFVVTLVSDILVRDPANGQYTSQLIHTLSAALKTTLKPAASAARRGALRIAEVGGFNRKWRMPLAQAQALQAGSVFVFMAETELKAEVVRAVEWRGLGERRVEGLGRLLFGWQIDEEVWPEPRHQLAEEAELPDLSGLSLTLGERMADRLLRRDLDRSLRATVNNLTMDDPPSNAQLSRLRVIARDVLGASAEPDAFQRLSKLFNSIQQRRTVRDQFDRARIRRVDEREGVRLSAWLSERLDGWETVWDHLENSRVIRHQLARNIVSSVEGNEGLAREYTLRLIDGVLAKAAQERRQREG